LRPRPEPSAAAPRRQIDRPIPSETPSNKIWGSDAIASALRALDIPYIALNPGASYRGLHDSLVNHLGNSQPEMLLCLHEESAVHIAQGYAKVTERPIAAAVHSNVGLMHATMAIFNAWCDRTPVIIFGATGPVDAARRRPWIDWIHTARDQGALIRHYTKWDDQPASVAAAQEAILRANVLARTAPRGPVYINLDSTLQEEPVEAVPPVPDMARYQPPPPAEPAAAELRRAAEILTKGQRVVVLAGRVSRDEAAWQRRIELVEALGAKVVTDNKIAAAFPTDHPLHAAGPATHLPPAAAELLVNADAILSLDWVDLAGALRVAYGAKPIAAKIIKVSVDQYIHNGWSMDYQGLPPADVTLLAEPDVTVPLLLAAVRSLRPKAPALPPAPERAAAPPASALDTAASLNVPLLATGLKAALGGAEASLLHLPLSWAAHLWDFRHPLDYIGSEGGGGIGAGPGVAVGAALALRDGGSHRLPVAILGDGDFLMGVTALWTAAHYGIPLLIVVANNRSFFNDELHQERVAKERGRPVANRWIGQQIRGPDIDLAGMARAQGCVGIGPVEDPKTLVATLREGIAAVRSGKPCVVDVRVEPGYDPGTAVAMQRVARS
jgi:thiamine pyrophosphate-dependent acetolactate synthase large subunit-like protein